MRRLYSLFHSAAPAATRGGAAHYDGGGVGGAPRPAAAHGPRGATERRVRGMVCSRGLEWCSYAVAHWYRRLRIWRDG